MDKVKIASGAVAAILCGALGIGAFMAGVPGAEARADGGDAEKTMNQWGEEYPLQWGSYATIKINQQDGDKEGHYCMRTKELGPIQRDDRGYKPFRTEDENYPISWLTYDDVNGQWIVDESVFGVVEEATAYTKGCFSCRGSKYQEIEAREGSQIYTEPLDDEFISELNGQVWDCGLCHGDNPENPADARLTYWIECCGDMYDEFDPSERVCGQCHTTASHTSVDHYRYGFSVDGLYDSKIEQGQISVDEATGITTVSGIYLPDVEIIQGSKMHELGVSCVDCHMPQMVDPESGSTFTSHNASGSPLENEAAMEYCLTCHKSQGIATADDMVKMVREMQDEAGVALNALSEKCSETKALIAEAVEAGTLTGEAFDEVNDTYARAYARYQVALGDPNVAGMKIVHNPELTWVYIDEANAMLDEAAAKLA